ncbi:MAG TPA: hypothetical protein PKZ78_12000, partial [Candidatus Goldiibacteriota bacterium]|nr:hypothetical protein [Candidatus Goldiibacteriota bacterium]
TWTYTALTSGTITFSSNATGTDENSGLIKTSAAAVSGNVVIQTPAALTSVITASPAAVGLTENITVVMAVTNNGQATANGVVPSALVTSGTGTVTLTSAAPVAAVIAGGATVNYTWVYSADAIGTAIFEGTASGTDGNSGAVVSAVNAVSNTVAIQPNYPVMTSYVNVTPGTINYNQRYTAVLTVSNVGVVNAPAVTPGAVAAPLGGSVILTPAPGSMDIAAGGTGRFTWVLESDEAEGFADIVITAASGAETSSDVTSGNTNRITVVGDAVLASSVAIAPATVSAGQNVTVVMNVANSGNSAAEGVVPSALVKLGTANYAYVSGPVPGSQTIAAGANANYTWIYTASGNGNLAVNGYATGYSVYNKVTKTTTATDSNYITVQSPAALSAGIYVPGTKNIGQWFVVSMVVTNSGSAGATAVAPPVNLTVAGTGGAVRISGPTPATSAIAGGTAQVYQWTYSAAG